MPDRIERLRETLAQPASDSSDYDLNPGQRPPEGRLLRPAAVLLGLLDGAAGPEIVLTKRSSGLRHHPGQIALPGGKLEPGEPDPETAALREAQEEIGLDPAQVELIGRLPVHETVTGFSVTPVLARIHGAFTPVAQESEVEEIFRVPFDHVTDPARFRVERRIWQGQWRSYYTVPWGPYYIWGATARILRGLTPP